jgi:hypothetical protein
MRSLKRFLHLPEQERSLVFQAILATSVIRLTLALISLRTVQRLAVGISWRSDEILGADRIVWAIWSAARLVPRSTCLVQALAAQALLIRHGYTPRLTIGVTKDACDRFGAHAWVTCENEVVIGGHETGNYTALLNLGS